jgi:hypothetical protein
VAGKMTVREARKVLAIGSDDEKEAVKQELQAIAASNITDVLQWTATGAMALLHSKDIPVHVQKAIKKVKVTPNQYGNAIEVEMHDKLSALRVLARYHGLHEPNSDSDSRPSILGINLKGPEVTTYEVLDDGESNERDGSEPEIDPTPQGDDGQEDLF